MQIDILKALKLLEKGYTYRLAANEMGVKPDIFLTALNTGRISYKRINSMLLRGGQVAEDIYNEHFQKFAPPAPEIVLPPPNLLTDDRVLNVLKSIHGELAEIKHLLSSNRERKVQRAEGRLPNGVAWSKDEDEYLVLAFTTGEPGTWVADFIDRYPDRTKIAVKGRLQTLRERGVHVPLREELNKLKLVSKS